MILKEKLTKRHYAWIAQLAEHVHGKDGVLGSNPSPGSRYKFTKQIKKHQFL